jgi:hypothetical protein
LACICWFRKTYQKKAHSEEWGHQCLLVLCIRNELTEEWQMGGVEKIVEFTVFIDEITKVWAGFSIRQYKISKD